MSVLGIGFELDSVSVRQMLAFHNQFYHTNSAEADVVWIWLSFQANGSTSPLIFISVRIHCAHNLQTSDFRISIDRMQQHNAETAEKWLDLWWNVYIPEKYQMTPSEPDIAIYVLNVSKYRSKQLVLRLLRIVLEREKGEKTIAISTISRETRNAYVNHLRFRSIINGIYIAFSLATSTSYVRRWKMSTGIFDNQVICYKTIN